MDTWEKSREKAIPKRVASNSSIHGISTKGSKCGDATGQKEKDPNYPGTTDYRKAQAADDDYLADSSRQILTTPSQGWCVQCNIFCNGWHLLSFIKTWGRIPLVFLNLCLLSGKQRKKREFSTICLYELPPAQ